jgi:hypothetical protein
MSSVDKVDIDQEAEWQANFGSISGSRGAISAMICSKESEESNFVSGNEGGMAGMLMGASMVPVVMRDIRDRLSSRRDVQTQ